MTRPVTYRAWYHATKRLYDVRTMRLDAGGVCLLYLVPIGDENGRGLTTDESAAIELMQITGLRDRKGRDIYEGDILLLTLGQHRLEVRWSLTGFRFFDLARKDWHFLYAADLRRLEVIGNLYETPELLKGEVTPV